MIKEFIICVIIPMIVYLTILTPIIYYNELNRCNILGNSLGMKSELSFFTGCKITKDDGTEIIF